MTDSDNPKKEQMPENAEEYLQDIVYQLKRFGDVRVIRGSDIPKPEPMSEKAENLIREIVSLLEGLEHTSAKLSRYFRDSQFEPVSYSQKELEAYAKKLQNADNELNNFIDKYTDPDQWWESE